MALVIGTNCGFVSAAPTADPAETERVIDNRTWVCKFTTPVGCTNITELGFYVMSIYHESADFQIAIYTHNSGADAPDAVVGTIHTGNVTAANTPGWYKYTGLSIAVSAETVYWIGVGVEDTTSGSTSTQYGASSDSRVGYHDENNGVLTDPWGTWSASDVCPYAFYALCGAGGGELVIQDIDHAHAIENVALGPGYAPFDPVNANYLKDGSLSVSLGGAGMSPDPIAGEWSADIASPDGMFHPLHPTSPYADYFRIGRPVRISLGGNYDGEDRWWTRLTGYMDAPRYDHGSQTISVRGMDYMKRLTDTKLRSPDNFWGASQTFSTIASIVILGSEIYAEADALEIGAGEANNLTNWVEAEGDFSPIADGGGGSTYVARLMSDNEYTDASAYNNDIGSFTAGTTYTVSFKYKRVKTHALGNKLSCFVYKSGTGYSPWGSISNLSSETWATTSFQFTCPETTTARLAFKANEPVLAGTAYIYIDQVTIKPHTSDMINAAYELPAASNGPHSVTLDEGGGATPIFFGSGVDEWTYSESTRTLEFSVKKVIQAGTNNLVVHYFTTQDIVNVLADVLAEGPGDAGGGAGLYATRAAALAAMDYTDPDIDIGKVWFKPGPAFDAVRMLCERCNYRFWMDEAGVPHFKPAPTAGTSVFDFSETGHIQSPEDYQDIEEVRNRIVIEGIERGMYVAREDKKPSRFTGEAHNQDSIDAYLERTLSITNHLFQDQESIDAMCATLLAERKDPKWYSSIALPFNPVPLELGDTITWRVAFEPGYGPLYGTFLYGGLRYGPAESGATATGIIRDIKISGDRVNYQCEITSSS